MLPIAFLLLPALGYASITINIRAAPEKYDTLVTHVGEDSNIISDFERLSFGLTNQTLKEAVGLLDGGKPLDVFVKGPTPWGDLYTVYGWAEVNRQTKVKRVHTSVKREEVTLVKKLYTNNLTKEAVFTSNIKQVVVNKVSNVIKGNKLSVDIKLNIDLEQSIRPLKHLDYVSNLENNTAVNVNRTLRGNSDFKFDLKPLDTAEVFMNATKVTVHVLVDYETTLSGHVAVNYNPKYKNHHFWAYSVNEVLKAAEKPLVEKTRDLIVIEYFTDAKMILADVRTGSMIQSVNAAYVD